MTRLSKAALALLGGTALIAAAGLVARGSWHGRASPGPSPRLLSLQQAHAALHQELEEKIGHDALLDEAVADGGDVILALRASLVRDILRDVAVRYFDEVTLDLAPDVQVRKAGEVRVLGGIKAGTWRVSVTIDRLQGLLRAGPPRVDLSGSNQVRLSVPVRVARGEGTATVRFVWDSKSLANVLCRDFEVTRRLSGTVLPDEYTVAGTFVLSPGETTITARPVFPEKRFRIRADLAGRSWEQVRRAFEEQDKIGRCGIGVNPDDLVMRLRELGENGFDVRLPRKLFRPVELPASIRRAVTLEGYRIELAVRPKRFRVTPDTLWYSASVQTKVAAPAPTGGESR